MDSNRVELGLMTTLIPGCGSGNGLGYSLVLPGENPAAGRSSPEGARNLNGSPDGSVSESVTGLKESFPEKAIAVTIVGEERKFIVSAFPSLRDLKLLQ